ncbi:hypothetical protein CTI12_AA143770 [Artemisia annua]|uniref:Uncharacterized protein n=1 Tax=Artemisia annua TaxID=35608 RepID=A0A2U1PKP2_ARTAN|nr:hypothetical protein CTI12_AA143770 [Artemisia annua]
MTQARQDFSLLSNKFFKSIEAVVKEKKNKWTNVAVKHKENKERQVQSSGVQPNQRCYKRRINAKLFWKKFVVASQKPSKLWISLGKIFEKWSFQEYPQESMKNMGSRNHDRSKQHLEDKIYVWSCSFIRIGHNTCSTVNNTMPGQLISEEDVGIRPCAKL